MYNTNTYNSRYFNNVVKENNLIIKTSTNIEKIKAEYNYYYHLPNNLQRYFVQPFDLIVHTDYASYKMECINYKNLAQLFMSDYIDPKLFCHVLNYIDSFKNNTYTVDYHGVYNQSRYLVLEKTKERIKNYPKYSILFNRIENAFSRYINSRTTWNLCISHGDLCFSNIIWIKDIDMIKFIDPRGANDRYDIFMDEYYDLAKLAHSIFGKYESIIYKEKINYDHIESAFISYLQNKNVSVPLLNVYQASLFLSMIPLHIEDQHKVLQFETVCDTILKKVGF